MMLARSVVAALCFAGLLVASAGEHGVAHAEPATLRAFADVGAGAGLRFNNPYRLARPLGADAASVSSTAPFFDLTLGATWGERWLHGASLRWDASLTGVGQHVLTPSYVFARRWAEWEAFARAGLPIVLAPDPNVGAELGVGGVWFVRAGLGVSAELVGSLFQGAAVPDDKRPFYPVLSGQLGIFVEWERLP